jgi:hypothetical protein
LLRDLSTEEMSRFAVPAPAVDLCVSFLLRRAKFVEAMEVGSTSASGPTFHFLLFIYKLLLVFLKQVHERQAALVSSTYYTSQDPQLVQELLQTVETRRTLIEAHASIPTIPDSNFQL